MRTAIRLTALFSMLVLWGVPGRGSAHEVKVTLHPVNKSGESGTVILTETEDDKQTKVEVTVKGQPAGVAQPMHLHKGTCAKLGPMSKVSHGLPALEDGKATAVIDVPLDTLQAEHYAINGHKSAKSTVIVFCGDIPME